VKSQHAFIADILSLVTAAGIPYMITGSLASTYYGRPRTTQDIDLVIEADANRLNAFVAAAQQRGYYADANDAAEALSQRSMFNIIDVDSGYKLDLIVRKDREFSRQEFERRREITLLGTRAFMVSPEDSLDRTYLARWATELGLTTELGRLLAEARRHEEP
jgi:hypothetical protein